MTEWLCVCGKGGWGGGDASMQRISDSILDDELHSFFSFSFYFC